MKETIKTLLNRIPNENIDHRFILAIDGLSRSGKTTLVEQISQHLKGMDIPFFIFHIDDHIVERNRRYNTLHEEWYEYYCLQWDVDWLSQNFFHHLKHSQSFSLPYYDGETDTHSEHRISMPKACIIVVEGVFLQRKEWRSFFDYLVYLDCLRDKRFQRESDATQKNIEKFKNRYWKAEEYYIETENPIEKADLVLKS